MVNIQRSPTRLCWWVVFNGVILTTTDTKYEAVQLASDYKRLVGG